eukprot:11856195-Ditylum_brightwellii.AAC.1
MIVKVFIQEIYVPFFSLRIVGGDSPSCDVKWIIDASIEEHISVKVSEDSAMIWHEGNIEW